MRGRRTLIAATAGAASLFASGAARADGSPLTVIVTNVRRAVGHVRLEVCSRAEFLKPCVHSGSAPAQVGVTTVEVPDLPAGDWAIQAYLDENDNHQVDQNFLGIPKEGVGFSNDAPFSLGPPKFKRARFTHGDEPQTVTLKLRYLPG
ncbi:MAG: DUF2141 domain-containing protein [Caulobacteraceae bacterium]|nr:DUF2141 domain-containing protein [Caulobacter sp.]